MVKSSIVMKGLESKHAPCGLTKDRFVSVGLHQLRLCHLMSFHSQVQLQVQFSYCFAEHFFPLKLHVGSQVLSPTYDMDAYMAKLFGGDAWDLC